MHISSSIQSPLLPTVAQSAEAKRDTINSSSRSSSSWVYGRHPQSYKWSTFFIKSEQSRKSESLLFMYVPYPTEPFLAFLRPLQWIHHTTPEPQAEPDRIMWTTDNDFGWAMQPVLFSYQLSKETNDETIWLLELLVATFSKEKPWTHNKWVPPAASRWNKETARTASEPMLLSAVGRLRYRCRLCDDLQLKSEPIHSSK